VNLMSFTQRLAFFAACGFTSFVATANDPVTIEIEQDGEVVLQIPLVPMAPIDVDSETGWIRAIADSEFSCATDPEVTCEDVQVSMESPDFGSFSITPTSIGPGGSVSVNWSSTGAWECEGLGLAGTAWSDALKSPTGSQSVVMNVDPGTYEASIRCFNGPVDDVRGPIEVTVTEAGPTDPEIPEFCQGRQPPDMTATVNCVPGSNADCRNYAEVYRAEFPGLRQARQIFANRDEYIAMRFTVPTDISTSVSGDWQWVTPQLVPTSTGRNMQTISRCPGDFNQQVILDEMGPNCYLKQGALPPSSVQWAIVGGNVGSRCALEPGETYYFNVLYTNSAAGTPSSELNWQCGNDDPGPNQCSNNTTPNF